MVPEGKQDGILQGSERSMVRAMCGVQLYDGKRSMDLMLILGYNETIHQLLWQTVFVGMVICEERGWSCVEKAIRF